MSSKLFTACLEEELENLDWDDIGIKTDGEYLSNLRFADNTVQLSKSEENLQRTMKNFSRES